MSEAMKRIKPLNPRIAFSHDSEWSDYPDSIREPMEDGHVVTYVREIRQPVPRIMESYDLLRMFQENTYGGYKAKHAKKE